MKTTWKTPCVTSGGTRESKSDVISTVDRVLIPTYGKSKTSFTIHESQATTKRNFDAAACSCGIRAIGTGQSLVDATSEQDESISWEGGEDTFRKYFSSLLIHQLEE
ncbi:hypothetical protein CEXT_765741 [Caerostris extrusa]|uniref:Uncharacterized protein n=1 Tax=Caerostris extrusa TaxID=172846 RepID=A0AAV4XDR1_CAEEX|nr:hypothetical protein CEXT_765741 [Caerostris extrusa]